MPWPAAIETGLLLGPGGEFAFVVIGLATALRLVDAETVASFALAVTSLTMALIPVLGTDRAPPRRGWRRAKRLDPALTVVPPPTAKVDAIVIGHGRVGSSSARCSSATACPFIADRPRSRALVSHAAAEGCRSTTAMPRNPRS